MGTTAQGHVMISEALLSPLPPEILVGGLRIATLEEAEESSHFVIVIWAAKLFFLCKLQTRVGSLYLLRVPLGGQDRR